MTSDTALQLDSLQLASLQLDSEGHLVNHADWSPEVAHQLAKTLEIGLTDEHFLILNAVRDFYSDYGHSPTTRPLVKYLVQTLPDLAIDNQKLQILFNTGLVARHVNRLAGLPKPANCL